MTTEPNERKYKTADLISDLQSDVHRYKKVLNFKPNRSFDGIFSLIARNPSLLAILIHRIGFLIDNRLDKPQLNLFRKAFKFVYHLCVYFIVVATKVQISINTEIGEGIYLSEGKNIIIGAKRIGKQATIYHNVTIGTGFDDKVPEIGDFVTIGDNSVIYGGIRIGDDVTIKPGTVLSKNLPSNCVVGGILRKYYSGNGLLNLMLRPIR